MFSPSSRRRRQRQQRRRRKKRTRRRKRRRKKKKRRRRRKKRERRRRKQQSSYKNTNTQLPMFPIPLFLYNAENIFIYFLKTAVFLGMWLQKCFLKDTTNYIQFHGFCEGKVCGVSFIVLVFSLTSFFVLGCSFLHDLPSCLIKSIWCFRIRRVYLRHSHVVLRDFVTCTALEFNTS